MKMTDAIVVVKYACNMKSNKAAYYLILETINNGKDYELTPMILGYIISGYYKRLKGL